MTISAARETLVDESQRMREVIEDVEARLKTLNIGIATWVMCGDAEFGYARVNGQWRLALAKKDADAIALIDASRAYKVEALLTLRDLLKALQSNSDDLSNKIILAVHSAREVMKELLP